jgi:tetratricopeptide (TPR) repeat protein
MTFSFQRFRVVLSGVLVASFWLSPAKANAQDLVAVSSITGSSSIFVFRSSPKPRRFVSQTKPVRSNVQRLETVSRIKKQYETIARTEPREQRANVVDPSTPFKSIGPVEGAKRLAGIGEYYLQKGDYEQSIERFREALSLDDKNLSAKNGLADGLAAKGNALLLKDQAATAKAVFMEALKYDPKNSAANFGLGEVYAELDQFPEAIASYERSLAADKSLTEIYVPLGILYYETGEIAKADDYLTKALAISPNSAETQFYVGLVRVSQNKLDEALDAFQKAKALDPNYAEAYYNAAETLVKQKRTAEAISDYQKANSLKPNYFDALLGLGDAYLELKNYPDALASYKAALKLRNDNWEVYYGLGETYRWLENFNDAESNYNLAATFYTRLKDFNKDTAADIYSKAAYSIGLQCPNNMAKFLPCKWPTAVKDLEKAVEFGQNSLDYANLGWAYYNSARMDLDAKRTADGTAKLELAKVNLQKAISNPAVADAALQNLGAVQNDLGDFAGAIVSLKPVVERRPDWHFAAYALGTAYYLTNDFQNAAKNLQLAVNKEPNNTGYLLSLGLSYVRLKNKAEVHKVHDRLKTLNIPTANKLEIEARNAKVF